MQKSFSENKLKFGPVTVLKFNSSPLGAPNCPTTVYVKIPGKPMACMCAYVYVFLTQVRTQARGGWGVRRCERTTLAGQIISKSCSFSPATEFTPLILSSKSEFS